MNNLVGQARISHNVKKLDFDFKQGTCFIYGQFVVHLILSLYWLIKIQDLISFICNNEILFKSRHYQLLWTTVCVCVWSLGPSFEGGFYILIFNVKDSPPPHPLERNCLYIFLTQFFSMHAHHMYQVTSCEVWIYMWWLEGHLSGQPVDTPDFSDVILNENIFWHDLNY